MNCLYKSMKIVLVFSLTRVGQQDYKYTLDLVQKEKSPKIIPDSIIPDVWEKHLAGQSRTRPISPHCLLNPHQAGKHPDEKERYISHWI